MSRIAAAVVTMLVLVLGMQDNVAPADAAFPGTNGRIAFVVREGSQNHIWTMESDGSDRQQLTSGAVRDEMPRYSPDGSRIAFHRFLPQNGLWVMDADGAALQPIPGTGEGYSLTWSPDGQRIAFEQYLEGMQTEISVIGINGSGYQNLTQSTDAFESFPDWSPDGERIVYQRTVISVGTDLWVMDADGDNKQQLTFNPESGEPWPDWSPDGEQIVFASGSGSGQDIFVMDADGGTPENLTDDADEQRRPVFSPDGDSIAFDENADTVPAGGPAFFYIVVMELATGDERNISPGQAPVEYGPDWSVGEAPLLSWGDHNCDGAVDAEDALIGFRQTAEVDPAVPLQGDHCPLVGDALQTQSFGERIWGDIDCDGDIDGVDAMLILRDEARLEPANLQNCPALGITITEVGSGDARGHR